MSVSLDELWAMQCFQRFPIIRPLGHYHISTMPPKQPQKQAAKPQNAVSKATDAVPKPQQNGSMEGKPSEEERRQESVKAAKQAQELQRQSQELTQAAMAAGDPEERQRLLSEALNKSIESESFGKTAKYLQSGTFQGLLAGTSPGVIAGGSLGTLTGTLVGGVVTLIVGGLGGAIGSAVGYFHGPFFKLGDLAGSAMNKLTGNIGWKATDEQKQVLEKMINGVNETERPTDDELKSLGQGGTLSESKSKIQHAGDGGKTMTEAAKGYLPSWAGGPSAEPAQEQPAPAQASGQQKPQTQPSQQQKPQPQTSQQTQKPHPTPHEPQSDSGTQAKRAASSQRQSSRPKQAGTTAGGKTTPSQTPQKAAGSKQSGEKKKPRKLESRSTGASPAGPKSAGGKPGTRSQTVRAAS